MSDNQYFNPERANSHYVYQDVALQRTLMQRVFLWMFAGLGLTGLAAYMTIDNNWVYSLAENQGLFWGLVIAELALVWWISGMINRMSFITATALFALYSTLNGVTLSLILLVYTTESVVTTLFVTAAMFGSMALYGYTTKRDLSSWGSILMMALVGLIIASVVNIFLGSSMMGFVISIIGVVLFVGLTAYDVNRIKAMFADVYEDGEDVKKASLLGALSLYLDFINLFLYLLRLFGRRD